MESSCHQEKAESVAQVESPEVGLVALTFVLNPPVLLAPGMCYPHLLSEFLSSPTFSLHLAKLAHPSAFLLDVLPSGSPRPPASLERAAAVPGVFTTPHPISFMLWFSTP